MPPTASSAGTTRPLSRTTRSSKTNKRSGDIYGSGADGGLSNFRLETGEKIAEMGNPTVSSEYPIINSNSKFH